MNKIFFLLFLILLFACPSFGQLTRGNTANDRLIDAVSTRPWPGSNYPPLPMLTAAVRLGIDNELKDAGIREAYLQLDAKRRNVEWFDGIDRLEKKRAVWSLLSCLTHPSDDAQIYALRGLERINNKKAVSFILTYADAMAVREDGSENATIHGIIHETLAKTLSTLTGIRIKIHGQDPEKLKQGIILWRTWQQKRAN